MAQYSRSGSLDKHCVGTLSTCLHPVGQASSGHWYDMSQGKLGSAQPCRLYKNTVTVLCNGCPLPPLIKFNIGFAFKGAAYINRRGGGIRRGVTDLP